MLSSISIFKSTYKLLITIGLCMLLIVSGFILSSGTLLEEACFTNSGFESAKDWILMFLGFWVNEAAN